jgi:hypothetical protein
MANVTISTSFQKLTPARPALLSWRTKLTVAITASAWIKTVHRMGIAPTADGIRIGIRGICVSLSLPAVLPDQQSFIIRGYCRVSYGLF